MRSRRVLMTSLTLGMFLLQGTPALAQGTTISDSECQALRQRLAEHAKLSDGVRRMVALKTGTPVAAAPAPAPAPAAAAPTARAEAIRTRLQQIPQERQALEEQRLGAMMKLDISRAGQIQGQIQALDAEKAKLEAEQASLGTAAPAASPPTAEPDPTAGIRCADMPAAVDNALKTRRRELGAKEEQVGAVPLIALKGQTREQIGQEFATQFTSGPAAANQVGLFDADGNAQLDGFVDVPAPGVFRLVRQRPDGTMGFEVYSTAAAGAAPGYSELSRRLDETAARQTAQVFADLLGTRPAGATRTLTQTADFAQAYAQYQAGNFTEASRLGPSARTIEFQNLRGQTVRVLELLSPVTGGVSLRRLVVLVQPNDQEIWEETMTTVRPVSYTKTDVEVTRSRQTRTTAGAAVGTPIASAPAKFSIEP